MEDDAANLEATREIWIKLLDAIVLGVDIDDAVDVVSDKTLLSTVSLTSPSHEHVESQLDSQHFKLSLSERVHGSCTVHSRPPFHVKP